MLLDEVAGMMKSGETVVAWSACAAWVLIVSLNGTMPDAQCAVCSSMPEGTESLLLDEEARMVMSARCARDMVSAAASAAAARADAARLAFASRVLHRMRAAVPAGTASLRRSGRRDASCP